MPLIATFLSHGMHGGKYLDKILFGVIVRAVCDSGIRITWVQVSRFLVSHSDNDQWKCTMFTNKSYISACHVNKILQVNVFTMSKKWLIYLQQVIMCRKMIRKKFFSCKMYYIITGILS